MSKVYDKDYLDKARMVAKRIGLDVKEGTYMFLKVQI